VFENFSRAFVVGLWGRRVSDGICDGICDGCAVMRNRSDGR